MLNNGRGLRTRTAGAEPSVALTVNSKFELGRAT